MESGLPLECEQLLIAGYVLGNLSATEAALCEELMTANPELAEQARELQYALELAYAPVEVAPPSTLRAKILEQAAASVELTTREKPSFRLGWGKIMGAIATALILGLGISNYRLWQRLQVAQIQIPAEDALIFSLQATDKVPENATVKLIVDPNRLEATLTAENLPPLSPEQVYVLWTVVGREAPFTTDEKGAILTEVFEVDTQGRLSRKIVVPEVFRDEEKIQKLAITIEPRSAPQVHQGSILMSTTFD
ncbi:anti-sigma factor [Gloeocapsa sp. PCC 73106]|uniref:anti-sigma factor n=1 Tax=Gloeocapsa sp. PCC 73106 TaxID=102232 RepID=UPI0002ABD8AB|nr:anti-sigma factor [Gloeocapsa sp. PCC 73106]ELR96962.1 hypothetical protein GLO73106DRAFT_00007630 [Gloeocapsa sp. PCC 73106]